MSTTTTDLYSATDAQEWARQFIEIISDPANTGADPTDEGFMIGWFANAIETGRSHPHAT
jgi:hypothetical protein